MNQVSWCLLSILIYIKTCRSLIQDFNVIIHKKIMFNTIIKLTKIKFLLNFTKIEKYMYIKNIIMKI